MTSRYSIATDTGSSQSQPTTAHGVAGVRYWVRFASIPLFFSAMIASEALTGFSDDTDPSSQLDRFGTPGPASAEPFLTLAAAALFVGVIAFFTSAIRQRGGWVATIASWIGAVGVVGIAMPGVLHFFDAALAVLPQKDALHVLNQLNAVAGPVPLVVIVIAPLLALLLFAIASLRAGLATIWMFLVAAASFVVGFTPLPAILANVIMGIAFTWIAVRTIRSQGMTRVDSEG